MPGWGVFPQPEHKSRALKRHISDGLSPTAWLRNTDVSRWSLNLSYKRKSTSLGGYSISKRLRNCVGSWMSTSASHFSSLDLCPQHLALSGAERGASVDVQRCHLSAQAREEGQRAPPRAGQLAAVAAERCTVWTSPNTSQQLKGGMQ